MSGDTAVAAAPYRDSGQGAAYVFVQDGATTWIQQAEIVAADGIAGDYFGYSAAVSDSTAVVGAYNHMVGSNRSQGIAYTFATPADSYAFTHFTQLWQCGYWRQLSKEGDVEE